MRKLILLILAIIMGLSTYSVCYADAGTQDKNSTTVKINEYSFVANLAEKPKVELQAMGYNDNEIKTIKGYKYEFIKHFNSLKSKEKSELSGMGYDEVQINALYNFSGTSAEAMLLSSNCDLDLSINSIAWSASANRMKAKLSYVFLWSSKPAFCFTDAVALSWNDWMIDSKSSTVTYRYIYGYSTAHPDLYYAGTYVPNSGPTSFGGGFKFPMVKQDNYYWARNGSGAFMLSNSLKGKELSAYGAYGHRTIVGTATFSIPGVGSISFNLGTVIEDQDWVNSY